MAPRRAAPWLFAPLVLSLACAGPSASARSPDRPPLRVVTWNIFAGNDLERASNLTRVAALIDSLRADFVLLQEVDRRTARSGGVDQPAVLAQLTGMHAVFGRAMDYDGGEFGIAILSRWPVTVSRAFPLAIVRPAGVADRAYEPRTLLHVVAETAQGAVHVVNTHVDHQSDALLRQLQLVQLMAYVADAVPGGAAVVLGGDLNARPDAAETRALRIGFEDAWLQCGEGGGFTFRADRPDRRIDYVLLRGAGCTGARVLDSRLSDHRPVVVDVVPRR